MGKVSLFSFFSGTGFLDLGFEKQGFNIVFVNELKGSFFDAYKYSRKKLGIKDPTYGYSNTDIENYIFGEELTQLKSFVKKEKENNIVGFIGGPPCPDFSVGGKNKGRNGDNGKLSESYIKLICLTNPDFFIFENVKGLLRTKKHRLFFEELKEKVFKNDYITTEKLVNAIEYGVPQDRERIILFGIKKDLLAEEGVMSQFEWDKNKIFDQEEVFKLSWPTAEESFIESQITEHMKTLTVNYWFSKNDVQNHPNAKDRFVPRAGLKKFLTVKEGDVSKKSYKRLHRFRYSPTACYGNNEVHIHPTEPRRISVAEALSIQSMPKEFSLPLKMSLTDKFKTIGNGVPFLLSQGIANIVRSFLEENVRGKNETNGF